LKGNDVGRKRHAEAGNAGKKAKELFHDNNETENLQQLFKKKAKILKQ
jgi:hypothetical protein